MSVEKQRMQKELKLFEQIKTGMTENAVGEMTKDFEVKRGGSGFAIDSYTLSDHSIVRIWYNSGRVMAVKHGEKVLVGE